MITHTAIRINKVIIFNHLLLGRYVVCYTSKGLMWGQPEANPHQLNFNHRDS